MSWQWPQVTRHMPGILGTGGVTGLGAKLIIRLQLGLGHAMRCDELLQINRQLQGHRTYFFPGGAFRIGCNYKIIVINNFCIEEYVVLNLLAGDKAWRLWTGRKK